MSVQYIHTFSIFCFLLGVVDFVIVGKAFRQQNETGRWLGFAAAAAEIVTFSYLCSIITTNYRSVSISSSIYFSGIDWMLFFLLQFVCSFVGIRKGPKIRMALLAFAGYAVFDTGIMAVNPFMEIAVHYTPGYPVGAPFLYEIKPLYLLHLLFTYTLIAAALLILAYKSMKMPKQFRIPYVCNIAAIVSLVLLNSIFLYMRKGSVLTLLDCSIIGYTFVLLLMYWSAFTYRKNEMLKPLSLMIFENIDQGIMLFDYSDILVMSNQKAEELLNGIDFDEKTDMMDFMRHCQIPAEILRNDHSSLQMDWFGKEEGVLRCDFRRLRDNDGGAIGNLFVFSDPRQSMDILTGFRLWDEFRHYAERNPYLFDHPCTAVVFDLAGLGEVNSTMGREVGDQRIRNLARSIREIMPEGSDYIRGYEAHLIIVCHHCTEEDVRDKANKVASGGLGTVFYGMASTTYGTEGLLGGQEDGGRRNIIQTIEIASRALRVKKLLNQNSMRSQTLTSLLRALRESDVDTEAHVQRTGKMGAELAREIGLPDAETADLRLLCMMHDIGKIGIPLEILNKPGELTEQEWKILKSHVEKGYQIALSTDEFRHIAEMILYHHESWDGTGYPERLSGKRIPLLSRMIAIVDAYDAMVNNRAYRKGMTPEAAMKELETQAGRQFDPWLTERFLKVLREKTELTTGQMTGGDEIRVFHRLQTVLEPEAKGNTIRIPFSRYLLDIDDIVVEADDAFETLTGYRREEALGKLSQFDFIPDEDRDYYRVQVGDFFQKGSIAYLKHELLRRDGSRIWVVCCGKRYFDSAEKAFRSEILIYRSSGPEL